MRTVTRIKTVALSGLASLFVYATDAAADEILVDAGPGVKWVATCNRCVQQGSNVEVSVEPGDVIIFRHNNPGLKHGVAAAAPELAKIATRGEADSPNKIAVELPVRTMFGVADDQKIENFPVEITRIQIKPNFSGSLTVLCNVHTFGMTVTLKKN